MSQVEGLLLLLGIPLTLLLAGYWLVPALEDEDVTLRVSVAVLTGLGSLLLLVSIVNFFVPMTGLAAWACLTPVLLSLLWPKSRQLLRRDLVAAAGNKSTWIYAAVIALFFLFLLWPVLSNASLLLYDGTSNHDSFFWVADAEHLKRHTYMERPVVDALQPMPSAAAAIIGWWPAWGRMGAEGLIALCSAVAGLSPIKLYVYVTACLFLPWLAASHLAIRTFYSVRLSVTAQISLLALQPIFIFFYSNSNLPNLLGVIAGTSAIVAVESALRAGAERRRACLAWCGLLALSLHGLYCGYPEMAPFVLLPCGLLWLRAFFCKIAWRPRLLVAGAVVLSLLLNPASSFRAATGFQAAYLSARGDDRWGNIMDTLQGVQYLPALSTLSPPAVKWLGPWVGALLTALLIGGLVLTWRRARDASGALLASAGGLLLFGYTLFAHFVYGWQKSVQFAGIMASAAVAGAILDSLLTCQASSKNLRLLTRVSGGGLLAFLVFASGMQYREIYKWSERKIIAQDWFELRDLSRANLKAAPILIEPATFLMAFFHGMWAAYFLPDSHLYFASRGDQNGGYLRSVVFNEADKPIPTPAAILVSRPWADAFDANSPRLLTGHEYVLLQKSNRVFAMSGVFPLNGLPDSSSSQLNFEIQPHVNSALLLDLAPRAKNDLAPLVWTLTRHVEGSPDYAAKVTGAPPWQIKIPLEAGRRNQVSIANSAATGADDPLLFAIRRLRIENRP